MNIVPFTEAGFTEALSILKNGGVIAHATETCYGLACDLSNGKAVERLFAIKDRPMTQAVSALFESTDQAKSYVEWNELADELAAKHLPGPLTMIMTMRNDAPKKLFATPEGTKTIGVRISSHTTAQALVEAFGSPLSTTSANVHGEPNPYSAQDIIDQYQDKALLPDLLLDDGTIPPNDASTVIDISTGKIVVLRAGPLKF